MRIDKIDDDAACDSESVCDHKTAVSAGGGLTERQDWGATGGQRQIPLRQRRQSTSPSR